MGKQRKWRAFICAALGALALTPIASAGTLVETASAPFGTFGGIDFVQHTGRFVGATSSGEYRMPFEIIVPDDPAGGNGAVLVEPPHFGFGPIVRNFVLGDEFFFSRGFSYAAVGWGTLGLNPLDPTATDLILNGMPLASIPPSPTNGDVEIVIQFIDALRNDPFGASVMDGVERWYGAGASQTADVVWQQIHHRPEGQGLVDFTFMVAGFWRPVFDIPFWDAAFPTEFAPISGIGKVIFFATEAEQILSESEQFRRAVEGPLADLEHYRLYEFAGAPHLFQPPPLNPLNVTATARANFLAGDAWVRDGTPPPPSQIIDSAPAGSIDPVYGFETGIARDENLNALGGIRYPDVEVGRATFIASIQVGVPPGLVGGFVDLKCEPLADGSVRFPSHGDYVERSVAQVNALQAAGFLLADDAEILKQQAAENEVGKPGVCPGPGESMRQTAMFSDGAMPQRQTRRPERRSLESLVADAIEELSQMTVDEQSLGGVMALASDALSTCPSDLNLDGRVDFDDLMGVMSSYGDPYSFEDVLGVVHSWGACQ